MSDLLARATLALRESTAVDDVDEAAVARLERDLAAGELGRATHALRVDVPVHDGEETLARLEQSRAASALRDSTEVDRRVDEEGIGRLELALQRRHRRSRLSRWIAMPIAAVLVVMVGWASASGRLSKWIGVATHGEQERSEHERATPTPPTTTTAHAPIAKVPSAAPELPASAAPEGSTANTSASVAPTIAPVISAKPAGPDADALYRAAHEAHFVKRDPVAALAAWDRYLALAPHGRFALEAKYNRAISLVRLGRRAEAAGALRPFADGDYGGYRKEEARELLQTLE